MVTTMYVVSSVMMLLLWMLALLLVLVLVSDPLCILVYTIISCVLLVVVLAVCALLRLLFFLCVDVSVDMCVPVVVICSVGVAHGVDSTAVVAVYDVGSVGDCGYGVGMHCASWCSVVSVGVCVVVDADVVSVVVMCCDVVSISDVCYGIGYSVVVVEDVAVGAAGVVVGYVRGMSVGVYVTVGVEVVHGGVVVGHVVVCCVDDGMYAGAGVDITTT